MKRKLFKSELRDEAFEDEAVMRAIFPECFPDQRDEEIAKLHAEVERLTTFETVLSQNGDITAQTINNLRAELAETTKAMEFNFAQYLDVSRMLCEVQDELEEAKKDAERYRWLRQFPNNRNESLYAWSISPDRPETSIKYIHYLDAAIDAAMAKENLCTTK